MLPVKNTFELLEKIENENLLPKLIEQLNKDFQLSNIDESFDLNTSINQLMTFLNSVLKKLIQFNYEDYLNLLYRIDVPEKELATIKGSNLDENIEGVTFLIFKREFQKVWFKSKF